LLVLLAILALAAGLVVFSPPPGVSSAHLSEAIRPQRMPGASSGTAAPEPDGVTLLALRDRRSAESPSALAFSTRDWTPPPPPAPPQATVVAPAPQAPPLPFTYIGKMRESGQWIVFLASQERTYVIKDDMLIESKYRVEKVAPPTLTLIYLPLQQSQTLAIGSAE
jgi:hypothetical protein